MNMHGLFGGVLAMGALLGAVAIGVAGGLDQGSGVSAQGAAPVLAQGLVQDAEAAGLPLDSVREAQEQLQGAGFNPGPVTGVVHSQTREAIQKYQQVRGLPVNGELDDTTRGALRRERVVT